MVINAIGLPRTALSIQDESDQAISISDQVDQTQWDAFVRSQSNGSAFHLMAWQRMILDTFGHQPFHLVAKASRGNVIGVLPLFLVRSRIFGRLLVSTPQAAYGGILADSQG